MPQHAAWRRLAVVALLATTVLAGCSSDDIEEEPAELTDIAHPSRRLQHLWHHTVGEGTDEGFLFLTPALAGNTVFAADALGVVTSIDVGSGWQWWQVDLDEPLIAGAGADSQQVYVVSVQGEVIALSRTDGASRWRAQLPSEALSAPVSDGEVVVIQTVDGLTSALSTTNGAPRWQHVAPQPVLSFRGTAQPVIAGEITLLGTASGKLEAVSTQDGSPVWSYDVSVAKGRTELDRLVDVDGAPVVAGDTVYVVGFQGNLAALDLASGNEVWSRSASSLNGPAAGENVMVVAAADGRVYGFDRYSQREVWKNEALLWRRLTRPVALGDVVVVGDFEGYFHLLSMADGSLVGRLMVDSQGLRSSPFVSQDTLFVFGNGGDLLAYQLEEQPYYPSANRRRQDRD